MKTITQMNAACSTGMFRPLDTLLDILVPPSANDRLIMWTDPGLMSCPSAMCFMAIDSPRRPSHCIAITVHPCWSDHGPCYSAVNSVTATLDEPDYVRVALTSEVAVGGWRLEAVGPFPQPLLHWPQAAAGGNWGDWLHHPRHGPPVRHQSYANHMGWGTVVAKFSQARSPTFGSQIDSGEFTAKLQFVCVAARLCMVLQPCIVIPARLPFHCRTHHPEVSFAVV